jgi:hypothetical protein
MLKKYKTFQMSRQVHNPHMLRIKDLSQLILVVGGEELCAMSAEKLAMLADLLSTL